MRQNLELSILMSQSKKDIEMEKLKTMNAETFIATYGLYESIMAIIARVLILDFLKTMYLNKTISKQNIDEKIKLINESIFNELNTYTIPSEIEDEISLLTEGIKSTVNSINSIADANNELMGTLEVAMQYAESVKTWQDGYNQLKPYIESEFLI